MKKIDMEIKELITYLAKFIPIEWDRFTESGGQYNIYGWINRNDGKRDFVLIQTWVNDGKLNADFVTSSAKYSKDIYMCLYGTTKGHIGCKKIDNLL